MNDLGVAAGAFVAGVVVTLACFRIATNYLSRVRRREEDK